MVNGWGEGIRMKGGRILRERFYFVTPAMSHENVITRPPLFMGSVSSIKALQDPAVGTGATVVTVGIKRAN